MKAILFSGVLMGVLTVPPTLSMAGDVNGPSLRAVQAIEVSLPELSDDELAKVEGGANAGGVVQTGQAAGGLVAANVAVPVNVPVAVNNVSVQVLGGTTIQIDR
jgi:bacteriocin-like protein